MYTSYPRTYHDCISRVDCGKSSIMASLAHAQNKREWMSQALKMAEFALKCNEVPIGCVIVYKGAVIAKGCNEVNATKNATRHAEMIAIEQLFEYCSQSNFLPSNVCRDVTLYVTVEPCIMCAYALRSLGITQVVFGCSNDRFGGCGSVLNVHNCERLQHDKLNIEEDVLKEDAISFLQKFYEGDNPNTVGT